MPAGSADALTVAVLLTEHSQRTVTVVSTSRVDGLLSASSSVTSSCSTAPEHWQHLPRKLAHATNRPERVLIEQLTDILVEVGPPRVLVTGLDSTAGRSLHIVPAMMFCSDCWPPVCRSIGVRASDCYRVTHAKSACALLFLLIEVGMFRLSNVQNQDCALLDAQPRGV